MTWGALEKWYGFPRTPFDVSFMPRDKPAAVERFVDRETAAVIVEPIQGVGGAYDVGKPMLQALRRRCDEVGAVLIFDEVQCGMGRTRRALRRQLLRRGSRHHHRRQSLGQRISGIRPAAVARASRAQLKYDDMGTTFGGGPMACAVGRGGDRHHRIRIAARERASGIDLYPRALASSARSPACRAPDFCSA